MTTLKLIVNNDYLPRNLKTDEDLIYYFQDRNISDIYWLGYEWFWLVYMPALNRVIEKKSVDDETIAENYYLIGDVHDLSLIHI